MQGYSSLFNTSRNVMSPRAKPSPGVSGRPSIGSSKNLGRSLSVRSSQLMQVVFRTPYHVVETFGVSLPVLVTDALTFSERSTAVSVSISVDGWAWVVCGRRLLIWEYRQPVSQGQRLIVNRHCYELTLPRSDLAHKAQLVAVFTSQGNKVPSCIAVSPEGAVRYWPSISHEGVSVEDNADLQGQECDSLTNIAPIGCVLATTTSTILLVEPLISGGRHAITCRTLKMPHGWLGGIGCKVSSLIFGSLPTSQVTETKLAKVAAVALKEGRAGGWCVYVLAEHSLQKWYLYPGEMEKLVYECDINRIVREAFCDTVWESCAGSNSDLDIWMLDMQTLVEGGIMLLVAAVNKQVTPQLHYALGKLSTETTTAPTKFSEFCLLKNTGFYSEEYESELLDYKFLLVRRTAYIYNQKVIVAVSVMNDVDEADIIQFGTSGDSILGGALCGNVPILFSKLHGLVSVSSCDTSPHELSSNISYTDLSRTFDIPVPQYSEGSLNITISDKDLEKLASNKDTVSRMRAAFIQFVKNRRDLTECKKIVNELIPPGVDPLSDIDSELDVTVINMSQDLIDDIPSSDPRWFDETQNPAVLTYSSLQILHQLEDKSTALKLYISFLKEVQLWEKFRAVRIHGGIMATPYVLGEHAEKLVAAMALRKLHTSSGGGHAAIIDSAIRLLVDDRDMRDGLTHQDLFYRKVSDVHHFFQALSKRSQELVLSERQPQEVVHILAEMNVIIQTVLQEVIEFRQLQAEVFSTSSYLNSNHCVYIPWTSAPGEGGIKDALTKQRDISLKHGARATGDIVLKNQLLDQLVNIVDIILDGRKCQVESTRRSGEIDERSLESYEKERYELIHPFVEDAEYERAVILAEKYCDFLILIEICDYTDNKERLNQYMNKFDEQGFSQILYKWYVSERKHGKLLGLLQHQEKVDGQLDSLGEFLEHYPSLSWLLSVHTGNYKQAGETLEKLAEQESEYLQRKKSMLSFAKLALLASNERSDSAVKEIERINSELDLVSYQEDLPESVLSAYGLSADKIRVLTPTELVQMYISDEFLGASELEFKKALDLLAFIEDEERDELRNTIWCHAVLRDKWTDMVVGSPVDVIQNTIFFKLVELLHLMGTEVEEILPPVESILNSEKLGSLKESSNFQYLLRVGYEYVTRTMKEP